MLSLVRIARGARDVLGHPVTARVLRCMAVSVVVTALTTVVLITLAIGAGVAPGLANIVAVACGTAVSYVMNRRWVWRRTGPSSVARELTPFWVMNLCGLIISTAAVHVVGNATTSWPDTQRAIAVVSASLATWGVLWVVQFLILDRFIFRAPEIDAVVAGDQLAA